MAMMRTDGVLRTLDLVCLGRAELSQDAESGLRMEESNEFTGGAFKRYLVEQLDAGACCLLELACNIGRCKSDVVNAAGRIFLQEFRDRALGRSRLE